MRPGTAVAVAIVALAFAAGSVPVLAPTAANAEEGAKARRYAKKYDQRYRYTRKRDWREERAYEARANDLDPAGDYKGYPNWARAALAPKSNGNFR